MSLIRKTLAELLGTFWLTFAGCGSAAIAARFIATEGSTPLNLGIGHVGVSLAFGLALLTMTCALGHVSGCHLNPAVTVGLVVARRFSVAHLVPYVAAQIAGATAAAFLLAFLLTNQTTDWKTTREEDGRVTAEPLPRTLLDVSTGRGALATNGYGAIKEPAEVRGGYSPGGYSREACFVGEAVLTFVLVTIVLGSTDRRAPAGLGSLAIGAGLTAVYLMSLPLTNGGVNPARSIGPALVVRGDALAQLWLFLGAPLIGAALAGIAYPLLAGEAPEQAVPAPSEKANERGQSKGGKAAK